MVTKLVGSISTRLGSTAWSMEGTAARVEERRGHVEVLGFTVRNGAPETFLVKARRVVCAMPLFVASGVLPQLGEYGFNAHRDLPSRAPWLVSNFLIDGMPDEMQGVPLSWDNVVYQGEGLGYMVSTHQDIRVSPPRRSVFSAYQALSTGDPDDTRR